MMDTAVARRATEVFEAYRNPRAVLDVVLFGGEPLLNWQLIEDYVPWVTGTRRGLALSLFTNALAATRSRLDFILDHGGTVYVSLDGGFEHHRIRRPVSRRQFDHILAMIHHCVRGDPSRIVPYVVMRKDGVPKTDKILDFVASLGVQEIALARDQHERWNDEVRSVLLTKLKEWRWESRIRLRVFPDNFGCCDDCAPVGMMVYPDGAIYDLCHVCTSVLQARGPVDERTSAVTHVGHIDCADPLKLDREAKRRLIGVPLDCRTLHATPADYSSLDSVVSRADQAAGILAGLVATTRRGSSTSVR
jgi:MoaA/NifB/PqqE/SkfB family radical SAM enzyme